MGFLSLTSLGAGRGDGQLPSSTVVDYALRCSAIAGWAVESGAIVVLLGWLSGFDVLERLLPHLPRIVPLTAFAFLGLGLGLLAGAGPARADRPGTGGARSRWIFLGGLWALGIAAARTAVDVFGWNVAIDAFPLQAFIDPAGLIDVRMAPATAGNLALLGGALLLDGRRRWQSVVFQAFVWTALLVSCLSMGRYLYGGEPLLPLAQMSVPTTTLFLVAGIGILCLRPELGLVRLLQAPTQGGVLVRYLLAPLVVLPPFLGWLRLRGELAGLYGLGAGISLFALSNVLVIGALVWVAAHWLDLADRSRRQAEAKTRNQLERMQLLHHITRATAERQDPASIFQVAVRNVEERLPADFACIALHDRVADTLEVVALAVASHQLAPSLGLAERTTFPVGGNGLDRALGGLLVYEADLAQIPLPFPRRLAAAGLRSMVLAPLQAESQIFGLLLVARRAAQGFASGECEFLRQLCESVALASLQAELGRALHAAYEDLQATQRAVVQQERLRALGEMASGIAHDINNSISPAAMLTDLLLEQERNLSPEGRQRLRTVRRAVVDVAQTVSRMHELYRRRGIQNLEPVALNPLVEQVVELTRSRWRDMPQERGVVIEVLQRLAADLPLVRGVESEIREALTNLVLNAVDAMPDGGVLSFRTRLRHDERVLGPGMAPRELVVLEVGDSGTGMDEETRRRCFEPFFTTKGEHGSGLGLAMVFSVAERHEADVEIDSRPGEGTTVRLVFLAMPPEKAAPVTTGAIPVLPRLRLLVVDDDPLLLEILTEALSGDGHQVEAVDGGEDGLAVFRTALGQGRRFDLVFTDLGMPQVDGRRVAAGIKEMSPATPVILLTGWGQRMAGERDLPPHVDLVLTKPPRLKDLREALRRFRGDAPTR